MNRAPTTVSIPPIRRVGGQNGMGVEYKETDSDGEMEDMSLLDIIKDIHLLFKKSLDLRVKFNNALEELNELELIEKKKVLKAYADLEVDVKDELDELEVAEDSDIYMSDSDDENSVMESVNGEEEKYVGEFKKNDFWSFIDLFRNMFEKDNKLIDEYVIRAKKKLLEEREEQYNNYETEQSGGGIFTRGVRDYEFPPGKGIGGLLRARFS